MNNITLNKNEQYEADISALVDGELEANRVLEVVDLIASDKKLRDFYMEARQLQTFLHPEPEIEEDSTLPDDMWERITKEVEKKKARVFKLSSIPHSAIAAAAVIMIVFGLWAGGVLEMHRLDWESSVVQINLDETSNRMSEDRFMELTSELLQADRRYHRRMLEMMEVVNSRSIISEGSHEASLVRSEHTLDTQQDDVRLESSAESRTANPLEITFW